MTDFSLFSSAGIFYKDDCFIDSGGGGSQLLFQVYFF